MMNLSKKDNLTIIEMGDYRFKTNLIDRPCFRDLQRKQRLRNIRLNDVSTAIVAMYRKHHRRDGHHELKKNQRTHGRNNKIRRSRKGKGR